MDVKCFQLIRCIFCYVNPVSITNAKTQARKGLVLYRVITLKKTCLCKPLCDFKNIWKKSKQFIIKTSWERTTKKWPHVNGIPISSFVAKDSYKKDDVQQKQFLEDLVLLIVKKSFANASYWKLMVKRI